MAKLKVKRKSTWIDMTAMSDVTVLLLTFFILTSTFIKKEPVQVTTPGSVSEIQIPETNLLTILVDKEGRTFLSLDNQNHQAELLRKVGGEKGIEFTPEEIYQFSLLPTIGVPVREISSFLKLSDEDRDKRMLARGGVPTDSINNEFKLWVRQARLIVRKDLKLAIKADQATPYPMIKNIMGSLQEIRENQFNLLTSLKAGADAE
ncbi:MAG: biopolymer transporter ExbD [Prevotellaceae bacterium]|jgi:biopolymer transport protein ExbD|nr:biopolymer transporter ExbD [Prevotellaceae bacterium]